MSELTIEKLIELLFLCSLSNCCSYEQAWDLYIADATKKQFTFEQVKEYMDSLDVNIESTH